MSQAHDHGAELFVPCRKEKPGLTLYMSHGHNHGVELFVACRKEKPNLPVSLKEDSLFSMCSSTVLSFFMILGKMY